MMDACTWDHPGRAPFRGGDVAAAIAHYEFPPPVAMELVRRQRSLQADAVVYVQRDSIVAPFGTASGLRDMFYKGGRMCAGPVLRTKWSPTDSYSALVYCVKTYCIAVPTVCGNISRIDYVPAPPYKPKLIPPGELPRFYEGKPKSPPKVHTVPEPGSLALVGLALAAMWWRIRRNVTVLEGA